MEMENTTKDSRSIKEINDTLKKRGHVVTSWNDDAPTVFKLYFPPNCRVEAHTHSCDYSEIIIEGSQKVSGKWLYKGDIRVGLANKGYGPLIAGPEGASILVIFADGNWPAIGIGAGDGSTINASKLLAQFSAAENS